MASMRDFLDNMAAPVRSRGAVRLALHNPNARSASDIAGVERTARTLGMGYGLADAGGQDAALEARAREIEQNPVADAWTAKDEENIAFLNEDQQALADVYDSLVASGILHEADADRETVINASGAGDDVAAAWKRGVILNRIAGYGLQFQRGEYENLDELRANILAAQKELEALRGNASDALGIYGAIEQLPRMIGYDAQYAGAGALVGGTIGSAVPGIGTLAGAGVGGAMGMAYTAANSEQGSFAADLLVQKDDAGNYLDPAAVQKAASLYGLLSGAVEVGGDALMFKLFKPVGGTIREAFSRRAARDAIREAAANRSLWPALRAFAGGAGKAAAVEGAQEFAQEGISTQIEATAKNLLSDAGANYYREQQAGAFSREGLSRMLEAGMAAAKTGPWFYAIPGGIRLTLDTRSALRAREFAEAHKELADKVAATRTRELSPARMESYLQTAGLDGDVLIPADAAWELQRKGTDLAGPLGWDVRDMEESAALGHDLVMPAARLQALLPPEQMKAVADIMRESPHAKSALEAANLNEDLPADMDGLIEQAEDDALERSAIEGELERLRGEMTQAVASAPHLVGQIASGADAETSVGRYVDEHLGLIVRRARDISRMGIPMSDTLSRVSLQGLLKDEQGRTVTPEEADALAGRNAEEEALAPFWDAVWGRLNPDSLRTDFPDARRELAYRHGRGLFAVKGEGLSVDALAEELKTRGLLDSDADSSTLIERLKGMQRPDRRTRGKVGALFQVEGETIAAMQHRIREWLSPENLAQAQGKTREEIFAMFGNELEPIAVLPPQYLHYFRQAGSDNRIYSGKGYFIDHAVNHHPEVSSERYQDIQLILNSPDEVLLDRRTANAKVRDGLIFVKELDANYAVAVSMEEGSDGKIVMHKTFFKTKKNPFKKLERVPTSVGGVSTISHAAETVPGSSLSARDVEINITSTTQHVKSSLNQGNTSALGSTTFDASGNYVIRLFRGANLSTLTHETAHVFFLEMERLEREGLADERMLADLAALREWTAAMDDDAALKAEYDRYQKHAAYGGAEFDALPDYLKEDARSRAKQEMLARGFEQYLREGKAPSPQLEGVFARFRKWLMRVYRDALDLHVELSDEVRDVFDRMIAHEEEMELRTEADSSPLIQRPKGMRERQKTASVSLLQTPAENDVVYPDNGKPVGQVTPEIAATLRMNKPGVIVLDDIGLQHIEERHGKEIRSLGFPDGREFVGFVLGNLDAVYDVDGNGRKYDLVSRAMRPQGRVMIRLEFAESGDFYQVVTAGTVRRKYYDKKNPLWESANLNRSASGTPDAIFSGQSGKDSIVSLGPDGNPLFQTGNDEAPLVREGMTRKPDSAAAKVVSIPGNAVPEFSGMKDFADWLKDMLAEGGNVLIKSTGQEARFSSGNVKASVKRSRSREHRNTYAGLREMVENAEYDHYEKPDERHPDRGGQDVYYSALEMSGKLYSVRLKLDVVTEEQKASERGKGIFAGEDIRYKDHKLTEIEIAPAQDRGFTQMGKAAHGTDAISKVSLGVLRGSVKPSGIDGGTLFQGISDEVRDMFDRMLAHEEEMELRAEAADVREETARLLDALELKGARRQEIEGLITAAKDEAAERLRRARDADRLEQRRAWTREAREQMEREQVYVTRRAICRTPIDLAGFNDVNGEELGRALVGKLPGAAAWREGGVEPEVFAAEQGYGSAAAMARDIIDSPTPEERVRQLVDKRQAEHDALFDADEYLFGREQLAEQRERIAEALEAKVQAVTAEQRHRRETAGRTVSGEEAIPAPDDCADCGSAARRLAGRDRLRARARAVLDKRPMGEEVMPEQFRRAASRWMREERRAILRGDFGKALQANCRTRINIELARQSAERRGMLRTLEKKAKEFLEMDRADSDARFAVLVLSQNIGLFNPTRGMLADAGGKGWENVEAFAARMREVGLMGAEDALDRELFTTSRAWKGMKWGEFRPYAETMRMIMHMERESRTAETASGRVALEARAREIADSIHENNTRREPEARAERNEAVELLKKFHAAHLKADTVALLDGDIMGAAWRAIVRPVSDAAGKRAERLRRERDVLRKLFSVYSRRELEDMKGKRFTVPGIPDAITKEQALSVLLNSGSAGNLRRLMAGRNLAEEQIRAIVDTLDERDVRFAQAVWDYFETFGKEISDLEESLTGVRPEAVEARPVQTRFGLLRGGYYPVACDRELSARPVDTDRLGTQTGGMFPSLSRGPLKQRQAVGLGTPLSLSLDVIPRHVAETVHMLTFRRPVTEAAKILRRREVNGAIRETAGVAAAEALDGWLHHVAGERPARGGWDRAASWARKNAALYTMGFRLSAMLARMTGLLSPVAEIGPRWALRGVVDSYGRGSPLDVCRTVMELSPMMRDRIMSADREVFEVSSRLMEPDSSSRASDPFARMKSFMETRGSVPMGWVRMYFADLPIWNGAYARALKENGGDIAEAVLYADAVVERARAGGAARDLAAVRPGWEPGRLMTMFYSCFSALYNLSARRVAMLDMRRDAAAVYRLATLALPTWFAEPALMGALPGGGPGTRNVGDKTDAEDWIAWGAKEAFFHPAGMVFDMREAASPESCPDSCQESWQDAFDSAMRFGARAGKALQDGADGRELLSGRETTEQDAGFITARELQLLETFRDWLDGTSPERELGSLIRKKNRQAENE